MTKSILKVDNLCFEYNEKIHYKNNIHNKETKKNIHTIANNKRMKDMILKNISFEVEETEIVAFLGPSGCGKSTLLYLLGGLYQPTSGSIYLENKLFKKKMV